MNYEIYQKIQYLCNIIMISKHHIEGGKYMHYNNNKNEKYYYTVHPITFS